MKKLIAAVTTAGLLIVGTAGVAAAADAPSAKAPTHAGVKVRRIVAAGKIAATTIGIEPKALRDALQDGKSVADVAKSNNVDPQKVVDALDAAANKKIDEAVTNGKIDADKAATIKEKLPARITKLVNADLKGKLGHFRLRRHARRAGAVVAAKTIGVEPSALRDALKNGQSVADLAKSHNVDPKTVVDAVDAAANKKIDEAVANGKLKADRAAALKERLPERITKLVNATPRDRSGS